MGGVGGNIHYSGALVAPISEIIPMGFRHSGCSWILPRCSRQERGRLRGCK